MTKAKHLAFLSIFCALAMIFSYVEYLLPINIGVPGIKLGIANIVIVFTLYYLKPWDAIIINIVRVFIIGLLFGSLFSIMFSMAGAFLSFFVMWPLSRLKHFSVIGISITGAVAHNLGQLIIAAIILGVSQVLYYAPVLMVAGLVTGIVIGIVAKLILKNIRRIFLKENF